MIIKYIHAVTRELPKKSRKETASELKVLIDDRMADMDPDLSEEEKSEKVLRELGDPRELANSYRGKERYLIGPKYFYKYLFVMKIVVLFVFIGVSIASGLGVLFSTENIADVIGGYLLTLFSAILQGAAWVTGVFALLEYYGLSIETGMEDEKWDPSQLPVAPEEKAHISRGESVFSIIMSTIFLLLFFNFLEMIGIYYKIDGQFNVIPLFNTGEIASFKVIIFLVFIMNILIELIKIIRGRWTKKVASIVSVLNIVSATLTITIINNMTIWNDEFVQDFEEYMPISFERMILFITVVIIIITLGESVSALYKGIRYGEE
ncbi:HAAS signaling domain-containing protein [Lacticigenium naphthae]|uniref:HAAS signaling domain-containing protein n=1 Tax=Lacticigenium naphthae TaxID=515351 RepID=UPI0003FADE3F|nr:hypothetical protein [Lacticigenium naphthae]